MHIPGCEALHDGRTRDEAFELIRSLIDAICLMPDDGHLYQPD
jgi:hypothetical protein